MGKSKSEKELGLTYNDILIAYCKTLTESQSRDGYQILREHFDLAPRPRIIKLNASGEQDKQGKVRLRPGELDKLIKNNSDYKFHWLVAKLHSYLDDLEERSKYEAPLRSRLKQYGRISHYHKLTKGWVAQSYASEATPPRYNKEPNTLDFYSIKTEKQALEYIMSIATDDRLNNPEVEWLVSMYPKVAEKISEVSL